MKKKDSSEEQPYLDSSTESIATLFPKYTEIARKRRIAYVQAICLLQLLEEEKYVV